MIETNAVGPAEAAVSADRIAVTVRRFRERCDLSQEELARRAGLTRTYVSMIESGRRVPSVRVLDAIIQTCAAEMEGKLVEVLWKELFGQAE